MQKLQVNPGQVQLASLPPAHNSNGADIDAFIESLLAQDTLPPLSTELVPAALARGLGICTDAFLGQQGSNGRQGSKPSQPTTGPAAGPSSTPGVNRSNDKATETEKLQALMARVRKLEQQQGDATEAVLEPSKPQRIAPNQQAPASVLQYNNQQQRSVLFGTPPSQQAQHMQVAYAQQYAQQLAQQQQQQQQQAYMQAAYQQQAQQAAFGQYSSWPPNPYQQYPYYGMQYNMQYAQAVAASMAAAASPADIPPAGPEGGQCAPGITVATQVTEGAASDGEEGDEARAVKRPRLIWTQALHKRFLEAVGKCGGVGRALPKAIMKEMGVNGLTRENVASHLQKYRQRQQKADDDHACEDDLEEQPVAGQIVLPGSPGDGNAATNVLVNRQQGCNERPSEGHNKDKDAKLKKSDIEDVVNNALGNATLNPN